MESILNELYHYFYQPLDLPKLTQEIKGCREILTERLDKPERKVLLQLMDAQDAVADEIAEDGFTCGIKLGLCLAEELMRYRSREQKHI